jgi:hypothetical protein
VWSAPVWGTVLSLSVGGKVADNCPRTLSKVTELKPFYFSSFHSPKPIQL